MRLKFHRLSKSETKELIRRLEERFGAWSKRSEAMVLKGEGVTLYKLDDVVLFESDGEVVPVIDERNERLLAMMPSVKVDSGAVSRVAEGADVMRPGIRSVEGEFGENDVVVVRDEVYLKPIALCRALVNSKELVGLSKGRVLKNFHHVGDETWRTARRLLDDHRIT
ncbi:MAG: hypothetical protein NZ920_02140 [Aigarchaeota archaeon]|nr:hypothetical protein [Aigarchaeota archaeon]MDW8092574.1 PUA domain-containing protein [Nitrososphaerota archaeon]